MTSPGASGLEIAEPAGDALEPAWRLALRHLSGPERKRAVDAALAGNRTSQATLAAGLGGEVLIARRSDDLVGAIWAQEHAGRTAGISPPQLVDGEPDQTAIDLLRAAAQRIGARDVRLLQALLETDTGPDFRRMIAAGFVHACDLLYLVSLAKVFPSALPESPCELVTVQPADMPRLAQILERTYEGTLDCPRLNGVRSGDDILAGYLQTGTSGREHWYFCRHADQDVGCLLLGDHPGGDQWEVIYMGLLPAARGKGWGIVIARHAQWLCRRAGRARLVLAVDAANRPAIAAYAEAGFLAWDRRSVLLQIAAGGAAASGPRPLE